MRACPRAFVAGVVAIFALTQSHGADGTTTDGWKLSVLTGMNLTINSYSDNWAGDEISAFSWGAQFNGTAERAFTSWVSNKNTLKLQFGQTSLQRTLTSGAKEWRPMKKSSDLIDFESVARFTLQSYVDPFVGVRAVTQFADFRVPEQDYYFNPLVLTESFGVIRDVIKQERIDWTARLGGAVRQSIDRNVDLPDSLLPPSDLINDGGVEFVTDLKTSTADARISYTTQLKAFEAMFSSSADEVEGTPQEDHWRYPDISWENTLGVTLTRYVMLNLYAQLLYDREINENVRFRETVGLALTYSYAN